MKFLSFRYIFFLFLCGLIVLAGCHSAPGQSALATSTTAITNTPQPTKTIVVPETLTPTKTATYVKGLELRSSQKILLNVTTTWADIGLCYPQGSTEVWQSSYPFTEKKVFLSADPSTNYFAPTYSPDGQWIAFIESRPVFQNLDLENPSIPDPLGNDSIWIMRQDGSEKHRVSKYFDSFSLNHVHFCYPQSSIFPELAWSPDGKYIFFIVNQMIFANSSTDYYFLNVKTKESFIFNSGRYFTLNSFAWLSESGKFLYNSDNQYWTNQISSEGIDQSNAQLLPINSSIQNFSIDSGSGLNEPIIVSHNDSYTYFALWQLDSTQNSWIKIKEYMGSNPKIGTYWGIYSGGSDDLYFIDLKSLKIIGPISYKNKIGSYIYQFPEVKDASGKVIVSIIDSETNDIWGVDPNSSQEMFQLVDWDALDPEGKYSIIDQYHSCSWSP